MSRRLPIAMLAVILTAALAACGSHDPPRHTDPPAAHVEPPPPSTPAPPADEPPVAQTVAFETADGVTISAVLRQGATPDAPAVILVHKLSSSHVEWTALLERLSRRPALTTLAIDMRGHGASTHGPGGRTLAWGTLTDDDWRATALDVRAAVDYLASHAPVHPARIAAIGASIGSTAVLAAAAEEPRIVAVVVLSPGRAYHGFDAVMPATHLGERPVFALAAHDETDSVDMANTIDHIVPRGATLIVDGDAHGVDMFDSTPAAADRVSDFLRTALAPSQPPPPPG